MDLFYTAPADCSITTVILRADEFHHCTRVLRKRIGDEVMVTDGAGNLYRTTIAQIENDFAVARIVDVQKNYHESSLRLTLAIGLLKNPSRMELAVEKCTEIGVETFIPLHTSRVISHKVKINRWNNIVLAAMKQSCRTILPSVSLIQQFETMLAASSHFGVKLIAYEAVENSTNILSVMNKNAGASSAIVCIGPEGGFTEEEVRQAMAAGFVPVSLGQRRLRSETAAVVAASLILSSTH